MLQLECTPHMQMSLDLNSCVHIFEFLCLLGFHTAVASLYQRNVEGLLREAHAHTRTLKSEL